MAVSVDEKGNSYDEYLKKKYGKGDTLPSALGRTLDQANNELLNWRTDGAVNNSNFWGWLTGGAQDATASSVRKGAVRAGGSNNLFRSPETWSGPKSTQTKGLSTAEKLRQAQEFQRRGRADQDNAYANKAAQGQGGVAKTLADYLAEASGLVGGSGQDFGAERSRLNSRGQENDQMLQAMFRALKGDVASKAPAIQQQYDQSEQAINQQADSAAGNIKQAYQEARESAAQSNSILGIDEATQAIAQSPANSAEDQGFNTGTTDLVRQNYQGANTAGESAALDRNRGWENAAGLQGFESRTQNLRGLSDALAQLGQQEATSNEGRQSAALQLALQLQSADGQAVSDAAAQQQALAELLQTQQQQQFENNLASTKLTNGNWLAAYEQSGGDDAKLQAIAKQLGLI